MRGQDYLSCSQSPYQNHSKYSKMKGRGGREGGTYMPGSMKRWGSGRLHLECQGHKERS